MMNLPPIDFDDVQGLVRFAHVHLSESCFLLTKVIDPVAARRWLRTAPVTTAATADPIPDRALQVAFSANGLRALAVPEPMIRDFSEEFIAGMSADDNRSRRLGDVAGNDPRKWDWGGTDVDTPHLVVMLYARPGGIETWRAEIEGPDFTSAFHTQRSLDALGQGPREPFGFVDGISQPELDWQQSVRTDRHERDRYSNLLAIGEVLLGYANEYGQYTSRPLLDAESTPAARTLPAAEEQPELRDLGRNGTYLVVRQLAQDVPGFWQYLDRAADFDPQQREHLAAAMVGRQRDGSPLVSLKPEPVDAVDRKSAHSRLNRFTFDDDPHGVRCPVGAHIRRSNPRTGDFPPEVDGLFSRLVRMLGFGRRHPRDDLVASARFHRLLRRGRVYGSTLAPEEAIKPGAPADDRGLHFVALGANISRQFEFVQNAWSISSKFAGLPTEGDPLLGHRDPLLNGDATDRFTMPQADGPARCLRDLPHFVNVRGGAYFFMPGLRALRFIAALPERESE